MSHSEKCPVCEGSGEYKHWAKAPPNTCHGCKGKGWIEIGIEYLTAPQIIGPMWTKPSDYKPDFGTVTCGTSTIPNSDGKKRLGRTC